MDVLFEYLFQFKKLTFARIITNISKAACSIGLSVILGSVLDGLTLKNIVALKNSVIQCVLLVVFLILISGIDIAVTTRQTKELLNYMKNNIFSKIIHESMQKYRSMHSGNYISILNNDITIINEDFIENFFELIFQILSFGISLVIMVRINAIVTGIILGISLLSFTVVSKVSRQLTKQQICFSKSLENITKLATDIFSGIHVIKNYNITQKMEELYCEKDEIVEDNRKKYSVMIGIINIIMVSFSMLTYLTIIGFCAVSVMRASLSAGTALIIFQLSSNLTDPINEIISLISTMRSVKGIGDKIKGIRQDEVEMIEEVHKNTYEKEIIFQDITFCYDGKEDATLKKVNLKIEKGKKYALVGESGSGKSTFIKLLLRYYNTYKGKIFLDNTNIQHIRTDEYCQLVSSMEQETFIFDESLMDNICLYSSYSKKDIKQAIEGAGLNSVVKRLPDGLQTRLGEGGANLSGGERQRVAFARLLLRKTPILLLDEATANLDNGTTIRLENLILGNKDLTLISVTHRLIKQVLQKYDEIIVLKSGKIIEKGTFQELIKKEGYFYSLYQIQTVGV